MTNVPSTDESRNDYAGTAVQKASLIVGIGFLLVGILGFIPGITTNYDQLQFIGHHSDALLLGIFEVSVFHNIFHLIFGVLGIALAKNFSGSRNFLIWGGIVYLLLWIYGLIIDSESQANFVPLNDADDWLHLGLGIVMIALGFGLNRSSRAVSPSRPDMT